MTTSEVNCKVCGAATCEWMRDLYDDRHGYPELFEVRRCPACGFAQTEPPVQRDQLSALYRDYYPRPTLTAADVDAGHRLAAGKSAMQSWLDGDGTECCRYIRPGARVLDVGCGGCGAMLLARHLGASMVMGIEVDPNIRAIAHDLGLQVHIGQLADLPAEHGEFDFILARQVLEHEPDPARLLGEMRARLAPGGHIVLSFPNVDARSRVRNDRHWLHWHVPYHVNYFSRRSLRLLAKKCGLAIDWVRTVTPVAWSLYQERMARTPVERGKRDPFWDPKVRPAGPRVPRTLTLRDRANRLGTQAHRLRLAVRDRCADALGLGDSFVVMLHPAE